MTRVGKEAAPEDDKATPLRVLSKNEADVLGAIRIFDEKRLRRL